MNYFDVGLALLDFLSTLKDNKGEPLFKRVDFLQTLADVGEQRQFSPACYVVYRGESVKDTVGRGQRIQVVQQYSVIIAVSHSAAQINATATIKKAGEIIPVVLKQLIGKQLNEFSGPLKRVGSDTATFSNAFSYFAFSFETAIFL